MKFVIRYYFNGSIVDKFTASARESGFVGCYHDGKPYAPNPAHVIAGAPYHLRKAIARAQWADFGLSDTLRMHIYRKRDGAPLGTLYARFDSAPLVKP